MQIFPLHPLLAPEIRDLSLDQFEESEWTQIIKSLKNILFWFSGTRK